MIFKLLKVLAIGVLGSAYLFASVVFFLASIPWPGY